MKKQFLAQIMCTPDIMDNDALVVLVHEFGNIRAELDGQLMCDLNLENSYILDFTKKIIEWAAQKSYAFLDVNMHPRPVSTRTGTGKSKSVEDMSRDVVTYLWDNYILLSSAKRVVLIGTGPGCQALMHLIQSRRSSIMQHVCLVIQCTGLDKIPLVPKDSGNLLAWYRQVSLIVIPKDHPTLLEDRVVKRHGQILVNDETKSIKVLSKAFPVIKSKIEEKLGPGSKPNLDASSSDAAAYLASLLKVSN